MKWSNAMFTIVFAIGFAVGLITNQLTSAQQPPLKSTILQKVDLTGIKGKQVVMLLKEIAPGAVNEKSYDIGDEFGYILEGSCTFEIEGKQPVTSKPGDTYHVLPMQSHFARNLSTTAPVKVVVFLVTDSGHQLGIPVK